MVFENFFGSQLATLTCVVIGTCFYIYSMINMYSAGLDWESIVEKAAHDKNVKLDENISTVFNFIAHHPDYTMLIQTLILVVYGVSLGVLNHYRNDWTDRTRDKVEAVINAIIPLIFPITSTIIGFRFTPSDYTTELFTYTAASFICYIYALVLFSIAGLVESEYGFIDIFVAVALGFAIHFTPTGRELWLILACVAPVAVKNIIVAVVIISGRHGPPQAQAQAQDQAQGQGRGRGQRRGRGQAQAQAPIDEENPGQEGDGGNVIPRTSSVPTLTNRFHSLTGHY